MKTMLELPDSAVRGVLNRRRILIVAGALLLLVTASLWWPKSRQPDLSGKWYGSGWGTVDLKPNSGGGFHGTYTDTYGGTGTVQVAWIARSQRYEGKWGEGTYRHGDLSFAAPGTDRTIRGVYGASADCEFRPGIPSAEHFEWSSTPPSRPGKLHHLWNAVIGVFKADSSDGEQKEALRTSVWLHSKPRHSAKKPLSTVS